MKKLEKNPNHTKIWRWTENLWETDLHSRRTTVPHQSIFYIFSRAFPGKGDLCCHCSSVCLSDWPTLGGWLMSGRSQGRLFSVSAQTMWCVIWRNHQKLLCKCYFCQKYGVILGMLPHWGVVKSSGMGHPPPLVQGQRQPMPGGGESFHTDCPWTTIMWVKQGVTQSYQAF